MRLSGGFLGGLVLGAAVTAGVFLAVGRDPAARPRSGARDAGVPGPEPEAAALRAENAALRARLDEARDRATPAVPPSPGPPSPGSEPGAPAVAEAAADEARREAFARLREQLQEVRDAAPGSPRLLAAIEAWRMQAQGDAEPDVEVGSRAMMILAAWGKLQPEQVDAIAADFARLPPGAPGRPGLAATVARAWARDPRLAAWFDGLPPVEEPAVRAAVVESLDESPSDAYRDYLLRISRGERDADVLDEAWHEDPITVALTPEWAPRIIAAIEGRVAEGDLPAVVRGRGLFSIGLAGLYDAAGARAAIAGLLTREPDEGVRAFGVAVLDAVDRGEANVQVIDGLWSRHRRSFGK